MVDWLFWFGFLFFFIYISFLYLLRISLAAACKHWHFSFGCTPLREIWLHLVCSTLLSSWRLPSGPPPNPQPFLLQAGQTQFPHPVLDCPAPQSCWPSIGLSLACQCLLLGNSKLDMTQYTTCGLKNAGRRGITTSLKLLAALLLTQPGMWLAFIASRAHCWLVFSFSTPGPALQSCSLPSHSPACTLSGASSVPSEGLCICSAEVHEVSLTQKGCTVLHNISKSIIPFSRGKVFSMHLYLSFNFLALTRSQWMKN